jgi:hypothetical protein
MDRDIRILGLAALAAAIMAPAVAAAQAPPKPSIAPKTEQLDAKSCAGNRATIGKGGDLDTKDPQGRSLSDRLARSDGVICPPSQVDPEIHAPTPPGGDMPVIPPPGSPGGDPSIKPK